MKLTSFQSSSLTQNWRHILVGLCALGLSLPAMALTSDAGKAIQLSGDFSVSGGQASYSLPISVAPGRAGHQPSLSLEYRSDSPNGIMGMGWSLGGLSSIRRCGKNILKDGHWGGVNFDAKDRFCLDGERLIAISGKDGEHLTEYRLENNGYAKIVSFGRAGNGPESFKVWHKDGSVYQYGVSQDSRVELASKPSAYKWALNQISDVTKANHIRFIYHENNAAGTHRLARIEYVGGQVKFGYQSRPDSSAHYLGGSLLRRNQRLNSITTIASQGNEIGQYQLDYQLSPHTQRSQMNALRYCASGQCSTDIQFRWTGRDKVALGAATNTGLVDARYYDTNGDGQAESYGVVERDYGSWQAKKFTLKDLAGNTHHGVTSMNLAGNVAHPYIQRNACDKIYPPFNQIGAKSYLKGNGQFGVYCYNTVSPSHAVNYGDFNGDGAETEQKGYAIADINGDGIADKHSFDVATPGGYRYYITGYGSGSLPGAAQRNMGSNVISGVAQRNVGYFAISGESPRNMDFKALSDVNNDGYLDAIMREGKTGASYVSLFNGISFNSPIALNAKIGIFQKPTFADINNDGYPDLVAGKHIYLNQKNNQFATSPSITASNEIVGLQDINGDGWVDLLTRGNGRHDKTHVQRSSAHAQDKITVISEAGVDYTLSYLPATDNRVYTLEGKSQYPIKVVTPRRYLVYQVEKAPKGYQSTQYQYHYKGAKRHLNGGGFLGFASISKTERAEVTTQTTTDFIQTPLELTGKVASVRVKKNHHKVSEKEYQYESKSRQGYQAKYYHSYAKRVIKKTFGLGSEQIEKQEITTRVIDRFGNLIKETTQLSSQLEQAGAFTTETNYEYVSTGLNQKHQIYDLTSISNVSNINALVSSYRAGMGQYCAADGKVYFKPNDYVVLIHSDIDIPLVLERYDDYFYYQKSASHTDLDGLTTHSGQMVQVSAADFHASGAKACGQYTLTDYDGDGMLELATSTSTRTELVTETGGKYWQLGAIKKVHTRVSDTLSHLSRRTNTEIRYNQQGLPIQEVVINSEYDSDTMGSKSLTRRYQYDQWGNPLSDSVEGTDLPVRRSQYQYDSDGLFLRSTQNALGHQSNTRFDAKGQLIRTVSALKNRTTRQSYDAFGRQVTQTLPGVGNVTRNQYKLGNACPEALAQTFSCVISSLAAGGEVITHFDYAGREVRKLHTSFSGQRVVVDTRWDRSGRKTSVTRPQFVGESRPAPVVRFTYDALDREISKQEPASNQKVASYHTRYQGLKVTVTDARGFEHSTTSNLLGHILRKEEPDNAYQTYQYYPDGKLKSSTDSDGNTTQIRYDSFGHRVSLDDPDMGQWSYVYNAAGELIYKRDAKGVVTEIAYDQLGRKIKQTEGGQESTWRYDENGALGTLSGFSGRGNQTEYHYNQAGLRQEEAVTVAGETFTSFYYYDNFERIAREVRPNGQATDLTSAALAAHNPQNKLAVEYVYNPHGYVAAVRSPKTYADSVFTSAKFRQDIKQLLDQAMAQANQYLDKAERYATQERFFNDKAAQYNSKTINLHNLDSASLAMLGDGYRYKQWCNAQGECFLRPATWVMLHDDVITPLDVTLEGAIYRLTTQLASTAQPGVRHYQASLHAVSEPAFSAETLTPAHDFILGDYDGNGAKDLISNQDIYIAQADNQTRSELLFSADDLAHAGTVANSRYKFYVDLARELINLSEQVAMLSGNYCQYSNQLGGQQLDSSQRVACDNTQQVGQADHLNLILTQSQLDDSLQNSAYTYYWQRRETDAYDHTLSETLGNGLVNTYVHDANTGRPNYIATHKGSQLFNPAIKGSAAKGHNVRLLHYRYDNHNNVTYRADDQLGVTDTWQYDGLDRVVSNRIALRDASQHGLDNPDFNGPFVYRYDKLGNLLFKTGIGDYQYSGQQAGPHAVTKANGLNYQYDANGNMLRAWAQNSQTNERELEWTEFNKPSKIVRKGKAVEFFYDANHNRYLKKNSDGVETFYFGKAYERVTDSKTGVVQHKHFIYADGKLVALNTQTDNADDSLKDKQVRYLHYDALNSVDMITDGYGNTVERRSYDTWGKQRKVAWQSESPLEVMQLAITNRGYTGHEEIVEVGLVHMNGRVYDQELGRFISADPIVQAPFVTNSFNRYAYVWNNPLKYNDPTGFVVNEYSLRQFLNDTGKLSNGNNVRYTKDKLAPGHHKPQNSRENNDNSAENVTRVEKNSWQHKEFLEGKPVPRDDAIPGRYMRVDIVELSRKVRETITVTEQAVGTTEKMNQAMNTTVDIMNTFTPPALKIALESLRSVENRKSQEYVETTTIDTEYSTTIQKGMLDTKTNQLYRMGDKGKHDEKVVVSEKKDKEFKDYPGRPERYSQKTVGFESPSVSRGR